MQPLDRLEVTNFQSIADASVELGKFTVIVGPSNSGKSALLRALKAVVRNVNSPSAVRVGKNVFTARLGYGQTEVSVERGKSQSTYRLQLPNHQEEVYTKAGRTVPDDIQNVLDLPLPDGPDLVFSSQIDPPFLLAETGATAAKTLGDLTNVSRLHAAAREANRRRLEASKMYTIRIEDARAVAEKLKTEFSELPATKAAIQEAKGLLEDVRAKARLKETLESLISDFSLAESAEQSLMETLQGMPQPADIEMLAEKAGSLLAERHVLLDHIDTLSKVAQVEDMLTRHMEDDRLEEEKAAKEYHDMLIQAGTCPTCLQKVSA